MGVHEIGAPFRWSDSRYQLYHLSVGTRSNEWRLDIEIDGQPAGAVEIVGFAPRPAWSVGRGASAPTSLAAERLDELLLTVVDLIRLADDPKFAKYQLFWDRLVAAWTDEEVTACEPPMAVIVRHAQTLRRLVADLTEHPRRILRRTRELTRVDRVQQLDVACINWLSRQPGTNVYERAGPRQRILAVQRFASVDTLENRVLRDFCFRSDLVARAYLKRYESLSHSSRWKLVQGYGRECKFTDRDLHADGVSRPHPPVVPNYVLMHDARYRVLWRAYLEILRRLDEEDECWRWQHRLWADYCRLLIHGALRQSKPHLVAESPLRISQEQFRGVWSQIGTQSLVRIASEPGCDDIAISMLWDIARNHPKLPPWVSGLGASAVIHIQSLADQREGYILIWSLHTFGEDAPELEASVRSAATSLKAVRDRIALDEDRDAFVAGLVLMSNAGDLHSRQALHHEGDVSGYRFGVSLEDRKRMFSRLPQTVARLANRALGNLPSQIDA